MASAAAGSRLNEGLDFLGAAPEADIVMVKLKGAKQYFRDFYIIADGVPAYETNDLLLGIKYLRKFQIPFVRPLVICVGVGSSFGDHTDSSVLSQYLQSVAVEANQAVVIGGGNEGGAAHHYQGNMNDKEVDPVEIRVGENTKGFIAELWGNVPDLYSISIRSPGGETTPTINFRSGLNMEYPFVYDKTTVRVDYQLNEQDTGRGLAVLRFTSPSPGVWTILVRRDVANGNGIFHIWLPLQQFVQGEIAFLQPSPEVTLTQPSFTSAATTVSTYNSKTNSFYFNSGQGFSLDGGIKPDLAAPGVDIPVATGILGGRTVVGVSTGSSMAAAITAGAAAQLLQWFVVEEHSPYAGSIAVRNSLVRGAAREPAYTYPNRQWGYGRLDMEGVFRWIAGIDT